MTGYSETPLTKKLGIKENYRVAILNAPQGFSETLGALAPGVQLLKTVKKPLDLILFFTKSHAQLTRRIAELAGRLPANGMLWIAYPKKASGVPTDLNFDLRSEEHTSELQSH